MLLCYVIENCWLLARTVPFSSLIWDQFWLEAISDATSDFD